MINKFLLQIAFFCVSFLAASFYFLLPREDISLIILDLPVVYNVRSTTQEPFSLISPTSIEGFVFRTDCLKLSAMSDAEVVKKYMPQDMGGNGELVIKSMRGSNSVHVAFTHVYSNDFNFQEFTGCLKNKVDAVSDIAKSSGITELIPLKITLETKFQTKVKWAIPLLIFISFFSFLNFVAAVFRFYRKLP